MQYMLNNLMTITKKCIKLKITRSYCAITATDTTLRNDIGSPHETITPKQQDEVQRSLHVAVIGVPNVGKSTFINNLINHRVCPTSSKVHTTRNASKAIYTTGNTQLVFYDTPGLVTHREIKKHNLEKSFRSAYRHAVQHADIMAVMHDVSNSWTRNGLHGTVIDTLKEYSTMPSFLILNKIDAIKSKRILLDTIRTLTNNTLKCDNRSKHRPSIPLVRDIAAANVDTTDEHELKRDKSWNYFHNVFLVSSITGDGLNEIHDYLINSAQPSNWTYPRDTFTDVSPEILIEDSVRARLLDYLPQEIPYSLKTVLDFYNMQNNTIFASVQVICPTPRIERLICGESDGKLRQITERVTSDLVETFGKPISLTISTSSKK